MQLWTTPPSPTTSTMGARKSGGFGPAPPAYEEPGEWFEILLPSGVQLRCAVGCSGRSLAEVLWALEATGSC